MAAFAVLGGDVVLKPLFGSEGRGIARLEDEAIALRAFKLLEQLGSVLYLQRFIQHEGCDLRLLVVGDRVLRPCAAQPARLAHQHQPRRHGRAVRARPRADRNGKRAAAAVGAGGRRRPVARLRRPAIYPRSQRGARLEGRFRKPPGRTWRRWCWISCSTRVRRGQ